MRSFDLVPCLVGVVLVTMGAARGAVQPPAAGNPSGSFYERAKEGFYWGDDPSEIFEQEARPEEETEIPPRQARTQDPPKPSRADYTLDEVWRLHPDEFRPLFDTVWKDAVAAPTEENVFAYKQLEQVARLRAALFASVATLVTLKHPELSTTRHSPSSNPGMRAKHQAAAAEIKAVLTGARDTFGLLYFTSRGCPFCIEQDRILEYFRVKYGWEIKRVDVDQNPHVAKLFGVSTTPTLLLVHRDHETPLPVAVGVVALPALERNLYRGIRLLRGDVTPEDMWLYDYQRGGGYDPAAVSAPRLRGFGPDVSGRQPD